jgi:nitroreductase
MDGDIRRRVEDAMIRYLVEKNRSFRRFKQSPPVTRQDLEELVDIARISGSGGNLQPLAYYLSNDAKTNEAVFECLRWAGYLTTWMGPEPQERPTAYLVILRDNEVTTNFLVDHGIAAETIRLAAIEKGIGSCIVGSLDRAKLREALGIAPRYEILIVLAFGVPAEKVVLEPVQEGDIRYWRDPEGVLHVPKRALKDILIN